MNVMSKQTKRAVFNLDGALEDIDKVISKLDQKYEKKEVKNPNTGEMRIILIPVPPSHAKCPMCGK